MSSSADCGFCSFYPNWLQNWATSRVFVVVYAILGTVQTMAFIYMSVNISTLEKRFKIPSQTIGIILSGNEISEILSVLLCYYGGSGHRPRWIAIGVGFCAISCLVLTLPHIIYGAGQDAIALTKEHLNATLLSNSKDTHELPICSMNSRPESCDEEDLDDISILPRLLIFFSQFILGIGTTLYFGLGQTYMDDNTKKKNMPMLLGFTLAMRTIGPTFGFILAYFCLNIYINPSLHPIINEKDPRWIGAWWLGWLVLAVMMAILAGLLAMFPRELQKSKKKSKKTENALNESEIPLKPEIVAHIKKADNVETTSSLVEDKPTLKNFPKTAKRILKNKLLMFNIFAGVFYLLGASAYIHYTAKYLEVQYQSSSGGGTIITGPVTLFGMVLGYSISGILIGKFKPAPRLLFLWNVIVGFLVFLGMITYIFLGCESGKIHGIDFETEIVNLTLPCNAACHCENVKYSPVCHEASRTTFISACHAGCTSVINDTTFGHCSCVADLEPGLNGHNSFVGTSRITDDVSETYQVAAGVCKQDCFVPWMIFSAISGFINIIASSGKISGILMSYRCVETRDKSIAQGIILMIVSLFALIPGPIIIGAILDSTCLIWDFSCQNKGNCWLYHKDNFRYYVNATSAALCLVGIFFDSVVCYLSKGLDLYGEQEEEEQKRKAHALMNTEH